MSYHFSTVFRMVAAPTKPLPFMAMRHRDHLLQAVIRLDGRVEFEGVASKGRIKPGKDHRIELSYGGPLDVSVNVVGPFRLWTESLPSRLRGRWDRMRGITWIAGDHFEEED